MKQDLCTRVIDITQDYLGPAADRFIKRQVASHLNKKPEALSTADLAQLAEWIKVSLALLTEDEAILNNCKKRILALK